MRKCIIFIKIAVFACNFFSGQFRKKVPLIVGLPYVLVLEDMSSFLTKKKNCPPRMPKNAQMSSFSAPWTVKTCQITFPRKILRSYSTNYGLRTWWPFFVFDLHLILGEKLDIRGSDDPFFFFLGFTCFWAGNWTCADLMTLKQPVLLLRSENIVSRWKSARSASSEPKATFLAQLVFKVWPYWQFFYRSADAQGL